MINKVTWQRVHRLSRFVWAQRSPPSLPTTNSENKERIRIHLSSSWLNLTTLFRNFAAGCSLGAVYFAATTGRLAIGIPFSTLVVVAFLLFLLTTTQGRPFVYNNLCSPRLEESTLRRVLTTVARLSDTGRGFDCFCHCVNISKQNIYLPPTWRTTTGLRRSERVCRRSACHFAIALDPSHRDRTNR